MSWKFFAWLIQSQAGMGNCSVGREMRFLVEMLLLEEFIQMFSEGEIRVGSNVSQADSVWFAWKTALYQ